MIDPTREEVAVALFTLLQTLKGAPFLTITRRPQVWAQTTAFPAVYQGQPEDDYVHKNGTATPPEVTLDFYWYLQIDSGQDPNVSPDTELNNALDAVGNCLAVPFGQKQNLGLANVNHCWIEGRPQRAPGYLNGRGESLVPIKVLVPQ